MVEDTVDLSKLTVPQLKAICKERKIVGYSKLGKPALLERLRDSKDLGTAIDSGKAGSQAVATQDNQGPSASTGSVGAPPVSTTSDTPQASKSTANLDGTASSAHISTKNATSTKEALPHVPSAPSRNSLPPRPPLIATVCQVKDAEGHMSTHLELPKEPDRPQLQKALSSHAMPPPSTIPTKGGASAAKKTTGTKRHGKPLATKPTKKAKINPPVALPAPLALPAASSSSIEEASSTSSVPDTLQLLEKENLAIFRVVPNTVAHPNLPTGTGTAKRFKPLVVKKPNPDLSYRSAQLAPPPRPAQPRTNSVVEAKSPISLRYLELVTSQDSPKLVSITLPPPLQHRKRVQRWAIILSQVNEDGCRQCTLVSKMFRYAVYLSAQDRLNRDFPGKRTTKALGKYSTATTNFWPYLRFRQHEVFVRKELYTKSFLAGAIQKATGFSSEDVISRLLWGCPNDERQINIAFRFILTRFWFAVSVGGTNADAWLHATVTNAREVVPGEVWSVSFSSSKGSSQSPMTSTVYVLEATCEVIGHASPPVRPDEGESAPEDLDATLSPIRADWSSYIHSTLEQRVSGMPSLLSKLKWAHQEEYDRGISRAWLARISKEGEEGVERRRVAERYVLACVVANSVSGTWMSTMDMAQEYAGMPNRYGLTTSKAHRRDSINLFLPAHHHIESVHFTTSTSIPLHPALAVVQTPGREYFILKDNGMEVGCEEDGIAPLWMEILGCDNKGLPM